MTEYIIRKTGGRNYVVTIADGTGRVVKVTRTREDAVRWVNAQRPSMDEFADYIADRIGR